MLFGNKSLDMRVAIWHEWAFAAKRYSAKPASSSRRPMGPLRNRMEN